MFNLEENNPVSPITNSSSKFITILIIFGLIIATGLGIYLTQNKQTTKTKASGETVNIILKNPQASETILGDYTIKAESKTKIETKFLHGVLKVDDANPKTLDILRLDEQTVLLSIDLNTKNFTQGQHSLGIYLYNLSSGKPELLGSTVKQVRVEN